MEHEISSKQAQHTTPGSFSGSFASKAAGAGLIALILCGLSFYAGMAYQRNHAAATGATGQSAQSAAAAGGFGSFRGRRGAIGNVTAASATSITVQNQRTGSSQTFTINSATQVTNNGSSASASDIQVGDTVLVRAAAASSTTAVSISINPSFGGPGAAGSPASPPQST